MSDDDERRFFQEQINDQQAKVAGLEIMANNANDKVAQNSMKIDAANRRLDELNATISKIPDEDKIKEILEDSVNKTVATSAMRLFWGMITLGATAVGGWLMHLLGLNSD